MGVVAVALKQLGVAALLEHPAPVHGGDGGAGGDSGQAVGHHQGGAAHLHGGVGRVEASLVNGWVGGE